MLHTHKKYLHKSTDKTVTQQNKIMLHNKTYLILHSNSGDIPSSRFRLKRSPSCVYKYIINYEDKSHNTCYCTHRIC